MKKFKRDKTTIKQDNDFDSVKRSEWVLIFVVVSWPTNHRGLNISPRGVGLAVHGAQDLAAISRVCRLYASAIFAGHVYCASPICPGLLLRLSQCDEWATVAQTALDRAEASFKVDRLRLREAKRWLCGLRGCGRCLGCNIPNQVKAFIKLVKLLIL